MNLDALESTPEGYVTHSYACPCREARMREIWEAATLLLSLRMGLTWPEAERRLRAALDGWKPAMGTP